LPLINNFSNTFSLPREGEDLGGGGKDRLNLITVYPDYFKIYPVERKKFD